MADKPLVIYKRLPEIKRWSSISCLFEINHPSSINCLYKAGFDVIPIGSRIDDRFIGRISVIFDILSGFYYEIPIR